MNNTENKILYLNNSFIYNEFFKNFNLLSYTNTAAAILSATALSLAYTSYHYLTAPPYKVIKEGSQTLNKGEIDWVQAHKTTEKLNKFVKGVVFLKNALTPFIEGGTCSAMAFEFLDQYLLHREKLSPEKVIETISPNFETSSLFFRTRQAAFNTIQKDPEHPVSDFRRAKIEAMLKLYNIKVLDASDEVDITEKESLHKIKTILKKFENSFLILRILRPSKNHKEEKYGHSMVLIRDQGREYFYEPNQGVIEINKKYTAKAIHEFLIKLEDSWGISHASFYQVSR